MTGSPFTVSVGADVENISVSGTALNFCPVEQPAVVTVHNVRSERDVKVRVEGPSGQILPVSLKTDPKVPSNLSVSFLPREAGEHLIHLVYNGMSLSGSPFKTKVYNIKEICVKEMPKEIVVGKPVTFLGKKRSCFASCIICLLFTFSREIQDLASPLNLLVIKSRRQLLV